MRGEEERCANPDVLVFRNGQYDELCRALRASAPLESVAYLFAAAVPRLAGGWRLLVQQVRHVPNDEYRRRSAVSAEVSPIYFARVVEMARAKCLAVVQVHSHPDSDNTRPSSTDLFGESRTVPFLRRRVPGVPHARLIVGVAGCRAAIFPVRPGVASASLETYDLDIVDVSANVQYLSTMGESSSAEPGSNEGNRQEVRYERQVRAFGPAGQKTLQRVHVGIVGLGGTGSHVVQQLALLGISRFTLIDPDTLEETNLNRVLGAAYEDVGRLKVEIARDLILRGNPRATVACYPEDVRYRRVARRLLDVDAFFICTDSHGSRAVLNELSYQYLLPAFEMGVVISPRSSQPPQPQARIQMLAPGQACLDCSRVLDPEAVRRDMLSRTSREAECYGLGAGETQPAVVSLNGVAASMAVTMFLAAFANLHSVSRAQLVRFDRGDVRSLDTTPRSGCTICNCLRLAAGDKFLGPGMPDDYSSESVHADAT